MLHRDIVSASYGGGRVVGMIVCELSPGPSGLSLLMQSNGKFFTVYNAGVIRRGQSDAWGRSFSVEDEETMRVNCNELLKQGSVNNAIGRIQRRHAIENQPGRGVLEAWEIPMKLCISVERPNELSPQLVRYLDAPRNQRSRTERAMAYLKQKSPKQYRVLNACYFGPTPVSWVAKSWGISRQSVFELLQRGTLFLEEYGAVDTEPDKS